MVSVGVKIKEIQIQIKFKILFQLNFVITSPKFTPTYLVSVQVFQFGFDFLFGIKLFTNRFGSFQFGQFLDLPQ